MSSPHERNSPAPALLSDKNRDIECNTQSIVAFNAAFGIVRFSSCSRGCSLFLRHLDKPRVCFKTLTDDFTVSSIFSLGCREHTDRQLNVYPTLLNRVCIYLKPPTPRSAPRRQHTHDALVSYASIRDQLAPTKEWRRRGRCRRRKPGSRCRNAALPLVCMFGPTDRVGSQADTKERLAAQENDNICNILLTPRSTEDGLKATCSPRVG